jgi:hypothetical protein
MTLKRVPAHLFDSMMNVYLFSVHVARVNKYGTKRNGAGGGRTSLYSIEFSPHNDAGQGPGDDSVEFEDDIETRVPAPQLSPRPMTPRRVKRRSVISRGSTGRSSLPNCHDKRSSVRKGCHWYSEFLYFLCIVYNREVISYLSMCLCVLCPKPFYIYFT